MGRLCQARFTNLLMRLPTLQVSTSISFLQQEHVPFKLQFDLWIFEPQECFPGQHVALMVQLSFLDPIPSLRDAGEKAGLRHITLPFTCVSVNNLYIKL